MHNNSKPSSSFAPVIITMDAGELCHSYLTTCHFGALAVITAAVPLLGQTLSNYCICSTVRKVVFSTCLRDKRLELPLFPSPYDAINDQKPHEGFKIASFRCELAPEFSFSSRCWRTWSFWQVTSSPETLPPPPPPPPPFWTVVLPYNFYAVL